MSARRVLFILAFAAGALGVVAYAASARGGYRFPHSKHADAFSNCLECHAGIPQGDRSRFYTVTADKCSECHEADVVDRVQWDDLRNPQGNLKFDHAVHLSGGDMDCQDCHLEQGQSGPMAVALPDPAVCQNCHTASAHLAPDNECTMCHRPLSRAADWTAEDIANFPRPESHAVKDFLSSHGDLANKDPELCAVCHARDQCESCHLQPEGAGEAILSLERDPRVAVLAGEPWTLHAPGFTGEHRTAAAADKPRCESCHAADFCAECHESQVTPGFHGANYMMRHAAEAYARDTDCQSCHSTEVFCRDCHTQVGIAGNEALSSAYHDAEPFWLLSHGKAARQGMESCASCHQQTDCLTCHSARGGWGVNPHGSDFDADTMGDKNPVLCITCHFVVPEGD